MNSASWVSRALVAAAALALLAACASPGPRERGQVRLAAIEQAAGEPIESFRFWNLRSWEALGPQDVAVWTRFDEAYLLRVDGPCPGLEFASAIGVSSHMNRVTRRFDAVTFDKQNCRIAEIRPIDTRLLSQRGD
jgi:hypothetical protein